MAQKKIKHKFTVASPHMVGDGFRVNNYIPGPYNFKQETSPFVMLDYNPPYHFPPTPHRKGVGEHPHKGFETVTVVFEGILEHRDSTGAGGVIGPGDVQWMTAGSGLLHEEFQTQEMSENGGVQHMMQLWVNLPAKHKEAKPGYQTIMNTDIPVYKIDDKGSKARIIAGTFKGMKGPAKTFSPVELYDITLAAASELSFDLPANYNNMLLVTKGKVTVNGTAANFKDFILFENNGEAINVKADEDSSFMILSGEPLNEPIVSYGPFVMNTQEEIRQAIQDFQSGKFGVMS